MRGARPHPYGVPTARRARSVLPMRPAWLRTAPSLHAVGHRRPRFRLPWTTPRHPSAAPPLPAPACSKNPCPRKAWPCGRGAGREPRHRLPAGAGVDRAQGTRRASPAGRHLWSPWPSCTRVGTIGRSGHLGRDRTGERRRQGISPHSPRASASRQPPVHALPWPPGAPVVSPRASLPGSPSTWTHCLSRRAAPPSPATRVAPAACSCRHVLTERAAAWLPSGSEQPHGSLKSGLRAAFRPAPLHARVARMWGCLRALPRSVFGGRVTLREYEAAIRGAWLAHLACEHARA